MISNLLKCTICPKKPTFSDVSHLLTHVGSKGHLAHLHGLQVRSHQEVLAGQQLAIYNSWFQEHGVAALLSERMQQKEQKQADKKAANRRRMAASASGTKPRARKTTKKHVEPSAVSAYSAEAPAARQNREAAEVTDGGLPPISAASRYPIIVSSPHEMHTDSGNEDEYFPETAELDVETLEKSSLGSPKLKGTHWPGMALFDAAPEDLKRKRNQRKDGSVLEKLERNAALVQPTETVHSAVGAVLKHRHMDDLENDSPVEGEEIVIQPSPRKRKNLVPRLRRNTKNPGVRRPERMHQGQLNTPSKLADPSIDTLSLLTSTFPEEGAEDNDFKIAIRGNRRKKNIKSIDVYQDSSPPFGVDGSAERLPSTYIDTNISQPQFTFSQIPWFKHQTEILVPLKPVSDRLQSVHTGDVDIGKENDRSCFFGACFSPHRQTVANPLFLHGGNERFDADDPFANEHRFGSALVSNIDPFDDDDEFVPAKNPLMLAMEQLNALEAGEEIYGFDHIAKHHRQPLFAP